MRRRATNYPSRPSAVRPRARPDHSSLASLVRTAGTGTNGEYDLRVIGHGSPPFVPMPLPSLAHYRRGMGCGGGRPTTHRAHPPPPPHHVPGPTIHHWPVWFARRARIPVGAWGAAAGHQLPSAPILRRRRTPCPARPFIIGQFGSHGGHAFPQGHGVRRRATNCPARPSSAAAAPRARPDHSSLASLVRTAGTGTNGKHDPRVIGDTPRRSSPCPYCLTRTPCPPNGTNGLIPEPVEGCANLWHRLTCAKPRSTLTGSHRLRNH